MKNGSTSKLAIMVLLLTCTATFAGASMFELETVPISKLMEDPTVYDSTMAYRKISIIGNISEIGKQSVVITEDDLSLKVDATKAELFDGFELGEQAMVSGEFIHDPIEDDIIYPNYVLHYPIQHIGEVNVSSINSDPASYNGKYVTVKGELTGVDPSMGRYTMTLTDNSTEGHIKIYFYGSTDQQAGETAKITGLYNGGILHSEEMGSDFDPTDISAIIPGFSYLTGLIALGTMAILLSRRQY